jgi:tyrosine-protein phosphatase SIW14
MSMSLKMFATLAAGLVLAVKPLPAQTVASATNSTPVLRSAYAERLRVTGLANGGRVNDSLFRGAQPRMEGMQELKKLGVTTIVDLRGEDPSKLEWEKKQAETLGMRFVSIPVSGWGPPSNQQIAEFLELFRADAKGAKNKVYVHCRFGEDRTGVFVATYRMAYEGWPPEQAMNEMYAFGFNGFWHPSMKTFIRDFPARLKMSPELAEFKPSAAPVAIPAVPVATPTVTEAAKQAAGPAN